MSSDITRSEAIKTLKEHLSHWERLLREHICDEQEGIDTISALKLAIADLETDEAYQLEYERTTKNDLALIHTEGLDEGIRCAMCTNSMKSDRGCDGGCVVNETIYKKVLKVIQENTVPSVLPKSKTATENCIDCVYDEIETETGAHCKKCLEGDNSQYKYVFDYVRENLAIKALEQEPTTKNDLGVDCISRAEAIKCLECDFDITGKENMKTVVNYINSAHDKIVNLPRVKQEPVIDKIRAEIDKIYNREGNSFDCLNALDELKEFIDKYKAESEKA